MMCYLRIEIEFSDKDGPATLALTCEHEEVPLICCMSGFKSVSWYQFNSSSGGWSDFDGPGKPGR